MSKQQKQQVDGSQRRILYIDLAQLSGFFAKGLPGTFLALAAIEFTSFVWRPIAIVLYAVAFVVSSAYSLLLLRFDSRVGHDILETPWLEISQIGRGYGLPFVLSSLVAILVSFSELCRHLTLQFGGFAANQMGYWHWLRFGVSWIADNVLFNSSQILGWDVSEIRPIEPWAQILTVVFNVSLDLAAIAAVVKWLQIVRSIRFIRHDFATAYSSYIYARLFSLVNVSMPLILSIVFIVAIIEDGVSMQQVSTAIYYVALPLIGLWLTWVNARGVWVLPGIRDKLPAFLGFAVGTALLYFTVPPLLLYLGH